MAALPPILVFLTDKVDTPTARLKRLAYLPLVDRKPIMVFLEEPETHIRVI